MHSLVPKSNFRKKFVRRRTERMRLQGHRTEFQDINQESLDYEALVLAKTGVQITDLEGVDALIDALKSANLWIPDGLSYLIDFKPGRNADTGANACAIVGPNTLGPGATPVAAPPDPAVFFNTVSWNPMGVTTSSSGYITCPVTGYSFPHNPGLTMSLRMQLKSTAANNNKGMFGMHKDGQGSHNSTHGFHARRRNLNDEIKVERVVGGNILLMQPPVGSVFDDAGHDVNFRLDNGTARLRVDSDNKGVDTYNELNDMEPDHLILSARWNGGSPGDFGQWGFCCMAFFSRSLSDAECSDLEAALQL